MGMAGLAIPIFHTEFQKSAVFGQRFLFGKTMDSSNFLEKNIDL